MINASHINARPHVCTSVHLTMLDVLPEYPEFGVVFKCNKAALSGGAHLPPTNHKTELELIRTD